MNQFSDNILLQRWQTQRDALAFKELTTRYGGLVYSAAMRVLRNPADAEDVAQECFAKLSAAPPEPQNSLGAWLHTVAVRQAIDRVRADARRRDREAAWEAERPGTTNLELDDLLHHVDEAIAGLPPEQRDCIVGHFLRGIGQGELAAELGISRWTVQRRINEGVAQVREGLAQKGIAATAGALTAALGRLECSAAPSALAAALGKIAVAGCGERDVAAGAAAGQGIKLAGGLIVMKKTVGLAMGLVILAVAAWWQLAINPEEPASASDGIELTETRAPALSEDANSTASSEAASELAGNPVLGIAAVTPEPAAPDVKSFWPLLADPKVYAPEPLADPTKAATVIGVVVDSSGRAIPGAAVRLLIAGSGVPDAYAIADAGRLAHTAHLARQNEVANDPAFQRASVSDDSGAFVFDDIRFTGSFMVSACADNYTRSSATGVLEAESISEVSVALEDGQAMYGRVITPSGQPVPDASVGSIGLLGEGQVFGSTPPTETLRERTDSEGNFTLWLKDLDKDKDWFTGLHIKSAKHGEGFFYPVRIETDQRVTVTLESQLARLSGTIYLGGGIPAAKHRIQVTGMATISSGTSSLSSPGSFFESETSEDGAYVFEALPSLESFTAYVYAPDGTASAIRPLPALVAGEDNTWDCSLEAPTQVKGEVRGLGAGNPLPGILVRYVSDEKDSNVSGHTFSDANGMFSFDILSGAGDYTFRGRYRRDGRTGMNEEMKTTVALKPGEEKFVLLEIPAPWSRTLKVVDQFGAPIPGVHANETLEFPGYGSSTTSRMEVTDTEGRVTFDLIDPTAAASYFLYSDGYIAADTESVAAEPGEALPMETFVLYKSAEVVARLVDTDGAPIVNSKVKCEASYAEGRSTEAKSATDAGGWVTFAGELPATETALHFEIEAAEGEAELEAHIDGATLNPDAENDLGEIVMKARE